MLYTLNQVQIITSHNQKFLAYPVLKIIGRRSYSLANKNCNILVEEHPETINLSKFGIIRTTISTLDPIVT